MVKGSIESSPSISTEAVDDGFVKVSTAKKEARLGSSNCASGELGEEETEELSVMLGILPVLRFDARREPLLLVGVDGVSGMLCSSSEDKRLLSVLELSFTAADSANACCMTLTDGAVRAMLFVVEMSSVGSEIWGLPLRVLRLRVGTPLARLTEKARIIRPILRGSVVLTTV